MGNRIREFPAFGGDMIFGTTALTGTWYALQMLEATVFSTVTELGVTRTGLVTSITFAGGAIIYGAFTNFTLTSGAVRAYNTNE